MSFNRTSLELKLVLVIALAVSHCFNRTSLELKCLFEGHEIGMFIVSDLF